MSSVIPKDRTGLVRHPFKTDCWIPGERHQGNNLCVEIPIGEMMECTLGKPDLSKLTHNQLTQIQVELCNTRSGRTEGKVSNAFYSWATPDQLIPASMVDEFADKLIWFYGDPKRASDEVSKAQAQLLETANSNVGGNPMMSDELVIPYEMPAPKATMEVFNEISLDWKTQIYNNVVRRFGGKPSAYLQGVTKDTALPEQAVVEFADVVIKEYDNDPKLAASVLKTYITEHITVMSAVMMNNALKEKGLMGQITKVTDNMIEQVDTKGEQNAELQATLEKISQVTIDSTKHKETVADQARDPKKARRDREGTSGEKGQPGPLGAIRKRKKSKRKSQHIPNMQTKSVKRALGASILHMLGTVQRDTQDAQKRALLKELPAADIIELASGKKLPDYQANLINAAQAKADPDAPVVKRMTQIDDEYIKLLDSTIATYLDRSLLPDDITDDQYVAIFESVRDSFMAKRKLATKESIEINDQGQVFGDWRKGTDYTGNLDSQIVPVTVGLIGGSPNGKTYDVSIKVGDTDKYFLHYEKFTELTATELEVAVKYIQDRIDTEFWTGLKQTILDFLPVQHAEWKEKFTTDQILELIYKLVVGYTTGYTQAFIQKEHRDRQTTAQVQPADLG